MRRRVFDIPLAPLLGLLTLGAASQATPPALLINESPSLARGLYVRQFGVAAAPGRVVAAAPPPGAHAYLDALGRPEAALLLKRVAGAPGERVCAAGDTVLTPRGTAPRMASDRQGRPLPHWSGCGPLARDYVFLLGDSPASFDSRYFGPVDRQALKGVFRSVLTW